MQAAVSVSKTQDNCVEIHNLSFYQADHCIFDHLNMRIKQGQVTAIMGPSGTGKTTLLRLIGAQLKPDTGSINVFGENIHQLSSSALYKMRHRLGMLFQHGALFTNLSVYENVAFPLREHTQLSESMIRSIVLMKLQAMGLRGARNLMPSELSGGMVRRVALARAIVLDPEIIMYDEPFTGQDPINKGVLLKLIKTLNQSLGMTTIIVSHDIPETLAIADYVYILANGKIIGEGTSEQIANTRCEQVKQFIQGIPDGIVPFQFPTKLDYQTDLLGET